MRKFIAIVLGLIGLTFIISTIVNIFVKNKDITALAEVYVDMPQETYTLNVDQNNRFFSCVSPYGWSDDTGTTFPNFVLYCYRDNFVLGATAYDTTISNELQLLYNFNLSQRFETFTEVIGHFDDYTVQSSTFQIEGDFTVSSPQYDDFVCYEAQGYILKIYIHLKDIDRYYTITITSNYNNGSFNVVGGSSSKYFYRLSYYDINTLFSNGFHEGYNMGKADGLTQGEQTGFDKGYQQGIEEGFDGDLFGSSIVPSINSLLTIEILPGVSFSRILSIGFGLILMGIAIKVFLGDNFFMDGLFSYLYYTVFPSLGDAFGRLSAVASMSYEQFANMLQGGSLPYVYTNVFTGAISLDSFSIGWAGTILSLVSRLIVPLSLYSSPLWVVLLYCSFTIFIGVSL